MFKYSSFKYEYKTWRLPTKSEASTWNNYSQGKGDDGLMLCAHLATVNMSTCEDHTDNCNGAGYWTCLPAFIITSTISGSQFYAFKNVPGAYTTHLLDFNRTSSIRCVTEL